MRTTTKKKKPEEKQMKGTAINIFGFYHLSLKKIIIGFIFMYITFAFNIIKLYFAGGL